MRTINIAGDNLFRVAAVELADATQWIRIAELNGISDPIIGSMVSLLIPDINPDATGGIAPQ